MRSMWLLILGVVWWAGCTAVPDDVARPDGAILVAPTEGTGNPYWHPVFIAGRTVTLARPLPQGYDLRCEKGVGSLRVGSRFQYVNQQMEIVGPPPKSERAMSDARPNLYSMDIGMSTGLTTNVGMQFSDDREERWVLDANANMVIFNASAEVGYNDLASDKYLPRIYAGLSLYSQMLQFQNGWGDGGHSFRLRTNLALGYLLRADMESWADLLYPRTRNPLSAERYAPVLSLSVDYYETYKRYGVMLGMLW